ncbi:hypothetical protein BGZ94_004041 [Podila epigama]|nr:hypothetical protein BGZ94_004041 [Podila epigama]
MSTVEPAQEQIYAKFESYDFDNDNTFQSGLKSIVANNQTKTEKEQADAVQNAKFFYFSRFIHQFNYQQYLAWRTAGGSSATREKTEETQAEPPSISECEAPSDSNNPSYPKSFQEICELIASGKPIPGIRQIPNNLAEGTPSAPKLAPKPKPWERAATAAASTTSTAGTGQGHLQTSPDATIVTESLSQTQ